ncbi:hypothetical protein DFH27DRAFT_528264 [Peziza echinospora]|nr:hypothetical protein DFH27DRAFT_528264 [Peziza echinospora]
MERKTSTKKSWFSKSPKDKYPTKPHKKGKLGKMTDPTRAISEAEPFAVSQTASVGGLGSLPHKDIYGNPIAEPDLSNPTRSRWERPLDTIRSFEAAINKDARRQSAFYTVDSMDQTQKQVQHNPGPFDSSLYHRNNGAQRYAPVDAYQQGSHDDQQYRHHSIESFDRPRYDSRRQSMKSTRTSNFEQMPPVPHSVHPTKLGIPNRQYPDSGFQHSAPPSTPGSGPEQYNSNPTYGVSPYGSGHIVRQTDPDPDLQFNFNDTPAMNLGYPAQMDGQGHGYDEYAAHDNSHYTNNAGVVHVDTVGFGNEAQNGLVGAAAAIPRKSLSPITTQMQSHAPSPPAAVAAAPEPSKKKKSLLKRFSKA